MTTANDSGWLTISEYRDFYDVPRAFIVEPKSGLLLFADCAFDETLDDYPPSFKIRVFRPGTTSSNLPDDWREFGSRIVGDVGVVPMGDIRFDETRRKEVLIPGLADLVIAAERLLSHS